MDATVVTRKGQLTGRITCWIGEGRVEIEVDNGHRYIGELLEHNQRQGGKTR